MLCGETETRPLAVQMGGGEWRGVMEKATTVVQGEVRGLWVEVEMRRRVGENGDEQEK
jgi:hypothetical protein